MTKHIITAPAGDQGGAAVTPNCTARRSSSAGIPVDCCHVDSLGNVAAEFNEAFPPLDDTNGIK